MPAAADPRRQSLQQIAEARQSAAFVGRTAELDLFRRNFGQRPAGPRHRFVFHVSGRGETCRRMGRLQEALAAPDRALEIDPEYAWARQQRERPAASGGA
ncbi:tetratricopeptide repeat protein [Streptomyces sp. NPDC058221]|uniref:tetratricopeptide repeat protein n=1 Tax=Streptomyces sp. NPDC058221 TaxID=3346388 RepID=UPI0036EB0F07